MPPWSYQKAHFQQDELPQKAGNKQSELVMVDFIYLFLIYFNLFCRAN